MNYTPWNLDFSHSFTTKHEILKSKTTWVSNYPSGYLMILFWHPATFWWVRLFWSFFPQMPIACKPLARSSLNSPSKRLPSLAGWTSMRKSGMNTWCKEEIVGAKSKARACKDKCKENLIDPSENSVFWSIATLAAPNHPSFNLMHLNHFNCCCKSLGVPRRQSQSSCRPAPSNGCAEWWWQILKASTCEYVQPMLTYA